ncbi:hypothetical protein [Streptomyces daliensis]|uniref:Transposase n=1 Tax=Streptomyces daliensis TaxID=299421 RepID=A0A8T4IUR5_9ACTN|nr:hypothetical protein [Streptomyces daliensis]
MPGPLVGPTPVANGGTPFTWRDVELAQSSEEVGEGIGNNGAGFRGILLISDRPEIYSADPDSTLSPEMDGYCFRRCFQKIKTWRGLATRYDKTPESYEAGLHLRGSSMWLKLLTTTT